MAPSAAVREYVVSCYLRARGAADLIVPCEGLLVAPRDPRLHDLERVLGTGRGGAPINRRFQAITVKDGGFARHSNFVWALNQMPPVGGWGRLFGALSRQLGGADPASIAAALSASVDEGFERFLGCFRQGVFWGSFHNNFTLDGRFLDLELPTIFGRPIFGLLSRHGRLPRRERQTGGYVVGCEAVEHLAQVGAFMDHLQRRLRQLLAMGAVPNQTERRFVTAFLEALEAEVGPGHLLRDRARACARLSAAIIDTFGIGGADAAAVSAIVAGQYDSCFAGTRTDVGDLPLRRLPLRLARTESSLRLRAFCPGFVAPDGDFEEAQALNDALEEIDRSPTIDALLSRVQRLEGDLARRPAPRAAA